MSDDQQLAQQLAIECIDAINRELLEADNLLGHICIQIRAHGEFDAPMAGVDVLVNYQNGLQRYFEVVTFQELANLSVRTAEYTTGKPLIAVACISATTLHKAIKRYLISEEGLATGRRDENGDLVGAFNREVYSLYGTQFYPLHMDHD